MSQDYQSYLRFSLEESVWFQKGQEVGELVSISLDPNITIIENDQYVAIRGSLELTGEYKKVEDDATVTEEMISAPKFVQSVEEREEGICEFLHRFPVDITIPNNRIQSVYDVDVTVDSFDYAVPERSCLKLVADLTISGLYGEQQNVPDEEEAEQEIEVEPVRSESEASYKEKLEAETDEPVQQGTEEATASEPITTLDLTELEPLYRSEHPEDDQQDKNDYRPNLVLSYPTEAEETDQEDESGQFGYTKPFSAEAKKEPKKDESSQFSWGIPEQSVHRTVPKVPDITLSSNRLNQQEAELEPTTDESVQAGHNQVDEEIKAQEESSSSSSSTPLHVGLMKKFTKKKSMSIAEFLGRKTENEQQAKLKVCIVQQGDTLDSLSNRYHLPVQQIVKVNNLEGNQAVYEGQVLYIPGDR